MQCLVFCLNREFRQKTRLKIELNCAPGGYISHFTWWFSLADGGLRLSNSCSPPLITSRLKTPGTKLLSEKVVNFHFHCQIGIHFETEAFIEQCRSLSHSYMYDFAVCSCWVKITKVCKTTVCWFKSHSNYISRQHWRVGNDERPATGAQPITPQNATFSLNDWLCLHVSSQDALRHRLEFKSSGPIRGRHNDRGSILNLYLRLLSKGWTGQRCNHRGTSPAIKFMSAACFFWILRFSCTAFLSLTQMFE